MTRTTTRDLTGQLDARRAHVHEMWGRVAESWREHATYTDERHADETAALLERAQLRQGHRVLELATGAGGLGLAATRQVEPTGMVLISDVAPEMVAIAHDRLRQNPFVRTAVLDLEDIDQPDESFDVVLSRHGLQFALEPRRAAAEMNRVLRRGGRAALSVWAAREQNPWLAIVLDVVAGQLGRAVPPPGMPGPFAVTDPTELATILSAGGFTDIAVSAVKVPMTAASFDEWWRRTRDLAGPLSSLLAGLAPDVATAIRHRAIEATREYRTPEGIAFPGVALVASAARA